MRRLSKKRRAIAEEALTEAKVAQNLFWSALADLENALGIEVDGTRDLENTNVEDLIESARQE